MKTSNDRNLKSKYINLALGGMYAFIAVLFFIWGLNEILVEKEDCLKPLISFFCMGSCLVMGLITMSKDVTNKAKKVKKYS
ncbi:MAG: hypothetical protein ACK5JH_14555 [Anaerocolumna sp.]